jgi:hypothetical protein
MSITERNQTMSPLLRLPLELRLQIYELVVPPRVVHVRMKWTGICTPAGFRYSCLEDTKPLLSPHECLIMSHTVPFGSDWHALGQTCRQMHAETSWLPFQTFTWSFETAFTLDQWVSTKDRIPAYNKNAIRTVAVPTPGPYQSSEQKLSSLREILLFGVNNAMTTVAEEDTDSDKMGPAIITLKKDRVTDTWIRSGEHARYVQELFGSI